MDLTVKVVEHEINAEGRANVPNMDYSEYVVKNGIPDIYITVRYPNGECVSKKTDSEGTVVFTLPDDKKGTFMVYETLKNIQGHHWLEYFETLEVPQPVIQGLKSNQQVTSTTRRLYSIRSDKLSRVSIVEFGHTVYKPVPNDKTYILEVGTSGAQLREVDLKTGLSNEIKSYIGVKICGFAYNSKEKLLYLIRYADGSFSTYIIFRIDGDYNIVKIDPMYGGFKYNLNDSKFQGFTMDNEGNYLMSMRNDEGYRHISLKLEFNKNSLYYMLPQELGQEGPRELSQYPLVYNLVHNNKNKKYYGWVAGARLLEFSFTGRDTYAVKAISSGGPLYNNSDASYSFDNNTFFVIENQPSPGPYKIHRIDMNRYGFKEWREAGSYFHKYGAGYDEYCLGANDSSVYEINNTLITVNVSKYAFTPEFDTDGKQINIDNTHYVVYENTGISDVYITLRDSKGNCVSQKTDTSGNVTFPITLAGEYTVYETNQNITGTYDESYFDTLEAPQPVIQGLNSNQQVTSTTARKKKIIMGDSNETVNFGHTVYKPVSCNNNAYIIQSVKTSENPNTYKTNVLLQMNLMTNICKKLKTYTTNKDTMSITAFAYNPKEKLLYGIDYYNDNAIYRIDEDYNIIKIENSSPITNMNFGDCDNNGNYIIGNYNLNQVYKVNLNPNSLNYLEKVKMDVNRNLLIGKELIDGLYDIKYNNSTKKLYGYCRTDSTTTPPQNNIVEISMDFKENTITPIVIKTDQLKTSLVMKCCLGTDNGNLYFITQNGVVYKTDVSKSKPLVMTKVKELPELLDYSNLFEGNSANCSVSHEYDLGNAPESDTTDTAAYKTSLSNGGPVHYINNNIRIGKLVSPEENPITGEVLEDNDGVNLPLLPVSDISDKYSLSVKCYNNTSSPATLYGWLDFNTDGKFDTDEFTSAQVPSMNSEQLIDLTFTIPKNWVFSKDKTFIRLRLTTDTLEEGTIEGSKEDPRSLSNIKYLNNGVEKISLPAKDGEVEDWLVKIEDVPEIICESNVDPKVSYSGQQTKYIITVTNKSSVPVNDVVVRDDLPIEFKFIEGYYYDLSKVKIPINSAEELKTGVNIGTLDVNQKVEIIITVEVK